MKPVCDPSEGKWVHRRDVHPTTNVAGRRYMTGDGVEGVFYGQSIGTLDLWWFFPAAQQQETKQ